MICHYTKNSLCVHYFKYIMQFILFIVHDLSFIPRQGNNKINSYVHTEWAHLLLLTFTIGSKFK